MTILRRFGSGRPMDSNVLRPIIMGWPEVVRLKCAKSSGKCHGSVLRTPIPLSASVATMIVRRGFEGADVVNGKAF